MPTGRPIRTRFPSASAPKALRLADTDNSQAHSAKGTPSRLIRQNRNMALRLFAGDTISGSISLPSPGFFSPFPHGTGFAIGDRACLALPSGLGRFKRGSTCPALLRYHLNLLELLCTGLSPTAAGRSSPVPLILHNLLFHQPRTKDESFVRGGWWWWPYNPDR